MMNAIYFAIIDRHGLTKTLLAFGQRLKQLRLQQDLSQEQLGLIANSTGLTSAESNAACNVSLSNIFRLARALEVPAASFILRASKSNVEPFFLQRRGCRLPSRITRRDYRKKSHSIIRKRLPTN